MNSFYEHHEHSIRFHYRCFDGILLNGLIQPLQRPERVIGFFDAYRRLYPVSRDTLRGIADGFQEWLKSWSAKRNVPILDAPKGRRDAFVEPYFKAAAPDAVVVVLKAREPARIMTAIGDRAANRWRLQCAERWVVQDNFYVNDARSWPHVRAHAPRPAVLGADLLQPASLARQPPARGAHRLPAMRQRLHGLRRTSAAAGARRRTDPARPRQLRPEAACLLHAVLHPARAR